MDHKEQVYPLAPATRGRSDEESATLQAKELRRKKNIKYLGYAAIFIVFQTIVITVFAVVVMKIKTPDFKVRSVTIENFQSNITAPPSFTMRLIAQVTVKNKNFGHYKFENTTATVSYQGSTVGQTPIPKGRAKARRTRKMNVTMDATTTGTPNLSSDLSSGNLTLNTYSKLSGKVTVMMIMKKRKTVDMNCTMTYTIASNSVHDLKCE